MIPDRAGFGPQRPTKIREAALSLFGAEGFAVSIRAIADGAGCSAGLVSITSGTKTASEKPSTNP